MSEQFNMQVSMSRLDTELISVYLTANGWQQMTCRYEDRIYFEGEIHEDGVPYQLYLPTGRNVPKYRTLLQRAIYKLCGIEDKDPPELLRDIFAHRDRIAEKTPDRTARIRVINSGDSELRIRMNSRTNDYHLMPNESVELVYKPTDDGITAIEHNGSSIVIRDAGPRD